MPSSPTRSSPSRKDASGDFLHDPSLWQDLLPQPFRLVDELLEDLIVHALELAEEREQHQRKEKQRRSIPVVEEASVISSVREAKVLDRVNVGLEELIVVGGNDGLHLLRSASGEVASHLNCGPVAMVSTIAVPSSSPAAVLAVVLETGILRLCVSTGGSISMVTELPSEILLADMLLQADSGVGLRVASACFSTRCTYLAVTMSNMFTQVGHSAGQTVQPNSSVLVYMLPVKEWSSQLEQTTPASSKPVQAFSKPVLAISLTPPPLSSRLPCSTTDPMASLKAVEEHALLPATGLHHILTDTYLQNRRNAFISHRPTFASQTPPRHTSVADWRCPMVVFANTGEVQASVAVHWPEHCHLALHSLSHKSKLPDVLYRQDACVTAMATHSHYLALGLQTGLVNVHNTLTNTVWGCLSTGTTPVTALQFIQLDNLWLISGCEDGSIFSLLCIAPGNVQLTKLNDGFTPEGYATAIVQIATIPYAVSSLHSSGQVLVWDLQHHHPLCQLSLPPPFSAHQLISFADHLLITGYPSDSANEQFPVLFSWSLATAEPLRKVWLRASTGPTQKQEPLVSIMRNNPYECSVELLDQAAAKDRDELYQRLKERWKTVAIFT